MKPTIPPDTLALVVPCFSPQDGWGALLGERFTAFAKTQPNPAAVSLTLVHDGSPNGLAAHEVSDLKAAMPTVKLIDHPTNLGKGAALRTGFHAAPTALVYMYTDVDLPYTLTSMEAVAASVRTEGGVAAGERFEDYYAGVPRRRRWLSRSYRMVMRAAFRLPVSDSQAGLKAFDEAGRQVFLQTTVARFLVDLDFISRCRGKVPVRAVRVMLRPDVTFTDFGLGILRAEAGNFVNIMRRSWLG